MLWYKTDETITADWLAESASSIEAGQRPLLNLGHSNTTIDGIMALVALQKLTTNYQAIIQPMVASGGHSALWLLVLLQTSRTRLLDRNFGPENSRQRAAQSYAQEPAILFTGVDPSTQIAFLATQEPSEQSQSTILPKKYWVGLGKSMRSLFAPAIEPSTITPIESLPFTIAPIRAKYQAIQTAQKRTRSSRFPTREQSASIADKINTHEQTTWTARIMIGFAILLLLAALVI